MYFNINNNIKKSLCNNDFNYKCSSIVERIQNIFLKYKKFYNKKKCKK
jgi:hypothetical protein